MYKILLSLLLFVTISNFSFCQEKETPKLGEKIFILFTTEPCGPCESFKAEINKNPLKDRISKLFTKKYIVKDTERSKEWESYFKVVSPRSFPTSAIFEYDGKTYVFLDKKVGFLGTEKTLEWFNSIEKNFSLKYE